MAIIPFPDFNMKEPTAGQSPPLEIFKQTSMEWLGVLVRLSVHLFLIAILISGFMYLIAGADEDKTAAAKKNLVWAVTGMLIVFFSFAAVSFWADKIDFLKDFTGNPDSAISIVTIKVFELVITLSGAVFMLMLLFGGFKYLTGAGNEEETTKAKRQMLNSVIGLILTLAAWAIGVKLVGIIDSLK